MYQEAPGKKKMVAAAIELLICSLFFAIFLGGGSASAVVDSVKSLGGKFLIVAIPILTIAIGIPVFMVVASIFGLTRAKRPEKCKSCQTLGVVMILAGVLFTGGILYAIIHVFGVDMAFRSSLLTILLAMMVLCPVQFYFGARENWKYAEEERQEMEDRAAREAAGLPPRRFPFN